MIWRVGIGLAVVGGVILLAPRWWGSWSYSALAPAATQLSSAESAAKLVASPAPVPVTHLPTPTPVRAIYMSSWVAGTPSFRGTLVKVADETEVNSLVIDVKDYTGKIAFVTTNPKLTKFEASEDRVPDIREFLNTLHGKGIYVIARIAVFQDPHLTALRPDLTVKRASDGGVWQDRKGAKWLDPGAHEVWEYIAAVAHEAYNVGFDELNFDYIRYPSDGDMQDIAYPFSDPTGLSKPAVMQQFFAYLDKELSDVKAPLSVDLFGLTTTATDDLGIGQVLVDAAPYFDYIAPMVYPSHYPPTFMGFRNPAEHPYEVIKAALDEASHRLVAIGLPVTKLRPWLQDFNLGAIYTPEMIREEKRAVYDSQLDSWMMWSPSNQYTVGALEKS